MSAELATLQCCRCAGYFRVAAQGVTRARCPHCEWVARLGDFHAVQEGEVIDLPQQAGATDPKAGSGVRLWTEKGRYLMFGCPQCQRPMRLDRDEAGGLVDCPHCAMEIIAPDPASGAGARLTDAAKRRMGGFRRIEPRPHRPRRNDPSAGLPPTERGLETLEPAQEAQPNPFEPAANLSAARPSPVRSLGVERLGAAFQARDEVAVPQAFNWDQVKASPTPAEPAVAAEGDGVTKSGGGMFRLAAALLLLVIGGMLILLEMRRSKVSEPASTEPVTAEDPVDPEGEAAFSVAREALGKMAWREMLPHLRSADRVRPLMAAYYREHEFEPIVLVEWGSPMKVDIAGREYLQLHVESAEGERGIVGLERNADGEFLFDWEQWVDIARLEWQQFVTERPSSPRALRVTLARSSPLPHYLEDVGLSVDKAYALRVWLDDSTPPLVAILEKGTPGTAQVWGETSWELGRRVVAELSFPQGTALDDRVIVHRVLQGRWLKP